MKIDPLIALGIPTWGKVSIAWSQAYRHIGGPLGSNMIELPHVIGKPIAEARNELMQGAFNANAEFLFFIGDDVIIPHDALTRLLQRMWDNPDVAMVTGVYWTKAWPTQPYIWRGMQRGPYMDWKLGEFFEIDFAGCDCLLIRLTPEMKALGPDWFATDWTFEEGSAPTVMTATEDFYFYTRTRKAGLKLWCDTLVQCGHEDRASGMQFGLTSEMPQYGATEPELPVAKTDVAPQVKVADIGCGYNSPYFGTAEKVKIVRFDANEKALPDYRCDIRHLPVEDQSFDMVHSRHVLEHFGRKEMMPLLKEWTRILRVGGEFRISVPNLLHACGQVMLMEEGIVPVDPYPFWQLYGRQDDEFDLHHNGFTPKRLKLALERLGTLKNIEVTTSDGDGNLNVYAKAVKARHASRRALLPEWDAIEKAEEIEVPGLSERTNGHKEEESPIKAPVLKEST